jgi:hypothetical protein
MTIYLSWNCDFCGKCMITLSQAGVLYCENCRMSYGKQVNPNIILKMKNDIDKKKHSID